MKKAVGVFLAGAATAFLFDPEKGGERRAKINKWVQPAKQWAQRTAPAAEAARTQLESKTAEITQNGLHAVSALQDRVKDAAATVTDRVDQLKTGSDKGTTPGEDPRTEVAPRPIADPIPEGETNDPTLVARVESELFRDDTLPKGKLNIDAVNGVVTLRGTIGDAVLAEDIVERTRAIDGVANVVDLLHR